MGRRNERWRRWGVSVVLAVVLAGALIAPACSSSKGSGSNQPPSPVAGRLAPDFTLTDLDGNTVTLSHLRGKTVFINFWATWCPPCRQEMPEIQKAYLEYKDRDVVIIGIDIAEPEDEVRRFITEGNYGWTFVIDKTGEVTRDYQIMPIPASFFIDRDGIIRVVKIGAMDLETIERMLDIAMR